MLESIWQLSGCARAEDHLLVLMHGRGDSAEGWRFFQKELGIPSLSVLLLNAPDPYSTGFSWYDLPPNQLPGIQRSSKLLDSVLTDIHRQGYPPERCILAGFSQGCMMSLEFGGRYPKRLAGYLGISGYCYDTEALLRESTPEVRSGKWLITHGTEDDVLPIDRTRAQVAELKRGGFQIDYREYWKSHTIDPIRELSEIRAWLRTVIAPPPRTPS